MPEQDKQTAGASYIISFYNDMENLTWYHASYLNILVELKANYTFTELAEQKQELGEEDQARLATIVQNLRAMVFRTYVKVKSLEEIVPEFKDKTARLNELKEKVIDRVVPVKQDVEDYVVLLNSMFVTGVVGELLIKSKDVLSGVVG